MKILACVMGVLLFLAGCSSNVVVTENPRSKEIALKYQNSHRVLEGKLTNVTASYTRQIIRGVKTPMTLELGIHAVVDIRSGTGNIHAGYNGEDLDPAACVYIDKNSFPVILQNRKNKMGSSYDGYDRGMEVTYGQSSSSDVAYGAGSSLRTVTVDSHIDCFLSAKIIFSQEMEKALLGAESLKIRMTTGGKPTVIMASGGQLEKIKELAGY